MHNLYNASSLQSICHFLIAREFAPVNYITISNLFSLVCRDTVRIDVNH